jgi:hypothetical protein
MSGVFRNIVPPPPHRPATVRGEDTLAGWRGGGGGVKSSEDDRHCSVLYICKYFVPPTVLIHRLRRAEIARRGPIHLQYWIILG